MEKKLWFLLLGLTVLSFPELYGQNDLLSIRNLERFTYEKTLSDSLNRIGYYPTISYTTGRIFNVINPQFSTVFNSKYPRTYNDGPVWNGKGLTTNISGGIQIKKGLFEATFAPVIFWSQNAKFKLAEVNPYQNKYNYQFGVTRYIDFVQRYGNKSFGQFHLGQSEIALRSKYFEMALSTQNFLLGPATFNSLLLSNSADGFPYLTFGTPRKIGISYKGIEFGKFDINLFYGLLKESQYFDDNSENNNRYFGALSVGYEIPYINGLYIGFHKTLYKRTNYFEAEDLYAVFYIADDGIIIDANGDTLVSSTNDTFDQLASAYIEWKLQNQGMRLFFEFARNDFNGSIRRILTEFEHSRAYSLGLDKVFTLSKGDLHLSYEHTFLPRYISFQHRANPAFYSHNLIRHGYTHNGQIIGAGIGPGSASDLINLNFLGSKRLMGLKLQRIRFDEDYFVSEINNNKDKIDKHDIEFTFGLRYQNSRSRLIWGVNSDLSYRFNMYFQSGNDKFNINAGFFLRYQILQ